MYSPHTFTQQQIKKNIQKCKKNRQVLFYSKIYISVYVYISFELKKEKFLFFFIFSYGYERKENDIPTLILKNKKREWNKLEK